MCEVCEELDRRQRFEAALERTVGDVSRPLPVPDPAAPYDWAVEGW